ncbi:uncharacterized protein NESG_01094 [Nematocida ausubeli]|uniref:Uncharacterized protein n=1 Tax=Nematocida ausubeli (strain ATCC PRA-371 / ERTm2) TaxID=1913371 RepID=A0A086J1G5_NEMA1|nr:uncharacterized protein NESG_01094 [Nematocida ausubeli]KAI5132538.1 hypothetical protein NEAUS07_0200 [Nematocida ausubeli]KAI5147073.1 hypothetical protein NEAUS05_0404 [Nematocida ausubeli]KFG25983.1 hypothetical protein NESG_01094 [Nematocida ausubeli]
MVDKFVDNIVSPLFALIGMSLLFGIVVLYLFQDKKPLIEKHAHYNIPTDVKPDITRILGEKIINLLTGSNDPTSAAVKAFIEVDSEAVCSDLRNNKIGEIYKAIKSAIPGIVETCDFCSIRNYPIAKYKKTEYNGQLNEIEGLNLKKDSCLNKIIDKRKILIEGKIDLDHADTRKYGSKELYIIYLSALIEFKWLCWKEMKMNLKYLSLTDAKAILVDKVMKKELEYERNLEAYYVLVTGDQTNESIKEENIHYTETYIEKNAENMNNIAKNLNLLKNIYNQETDSISKLLAKANDYLCLCISEDEKTDLRRPIRDLSTLFSDVKCTMPKTFKSD